MPIRFRCTACNQPIEVDDEAAGQSATCPYCRGLTPVPQFSTFSAAQSGPPVAAPSPMPGVPLQPMRPVAQPVPPAPQSRHAALSWIALACGALGFISYIATSIAMAPLMSEFTTTADARDMLNQMMPKLQANPSIMIVGMLMYLFMGAAFFFGLIGVILKAQPRWPAVVALGFTGVFASLMCCGGFQVLM